MKMRYALLGLAASILAAAISAPVAAAQERAGSWKPPRTAWGDPDLTGMWPVDSVTGTSLERAPTYGDRLYMTDEEYQRVLASNKTTVTRYDREDSANRIGSGHWFETNDKPLRQTSLIVKPANGRIPPLTAEGKARAEAMKSSWSGGVFERIGDFNSLDRCITRGLPASMIPFPYNNGLQIFQAPGYVVMNLEIVHESRIIPLGNQPHLPGGMTTWFGDSRGRWEGATLVIETTNFNGQTPMNIVGPGNSKVPTSTSMRIVERLTPTGPNTIQYEATIEDPLVLTSSWTMSFPLTRDDKYEAFEYNCHEGNTVVPNYIRTTSPRYVKNLTGVFKMQDWFRSTTGDNAGFTAEQKAAAEKAAAEKAGGPKDADK